MEQSIHIEGNQISGRGNRSVRACFLSVILLGSALRSVGTGLPVLASGKVTNTIPIEAEHRPAQPPTVGQIPPPLLLGNRGVVPTAAAISNSVQDSASAADPALRDSQRLVLTDNVRDRAPEKATTQEQKYQAFLDEALQRKRSGDVEHAEKLLSHLLESGAPEEIRKTALLQLAVCSHERQDLLRAQQIYAQFLKEYPTDAAAAEVFLRQGLIFRQMGAPVMALSKFYGVMSTALNVKSDRLEYYQRLVLLAQSEIADTYYLQGKHEEAAEFFSRLLKLESPELDKTKIQYKLIRCMALRGRSSDVIANAEQFLSRYPEAEPSAEVRFLFAEALKKLGRNREAMEQVLAMLESGQQGAAANPESWRYWRQRIGNEIANDLYQEGDYLNALQVYQSLAQLSNAPEWQLPAWYQVGLVYERLHQPQKALEAYDRVLGEQAKLKTNGPNPGLVAVFDMAKWRKGFLGWQKQADESNHQLNPSEISLPPQ